MPPFWQYFLQLAEADESIPDTKGRESWTPKHFYLQIGSFLGTATGGHDGDREPLWPAAHACRTGRTAQYANRPRRQERPAPLPLRALVRNVQRDYRWASLRLIEA
jgi:hypothetical protein